MTTMQVTNPSGSGRTLNTPQVISTMPSGVVSLAAINATGGQKDNPLPFPFSHVAPIAAAGASAALPVRLADFIRRATPHSPLTVGQEWNQLVQNNYVTLALTGTGAADGDLTDLLARTL